MPKVIVAGAVVGAVAPGGTALAATHTGPVPPRTDGTAATGGTRS